ncbi:hypothetical protein ACWEO4_36610 [Streptomyces sp. NPDC004393]
MTQQDRQRIASGLAGKIVEPAGQSGMPRMMARVHVDLLLSEDGRRTAAEPDPQAEGQPGLRLRGRELPGPGGFCRGRERDPQRRRDIYAVDDDACSPCDALTG